VNFGLEAVTSKGNGISADGESADEERAVVFGGGYLLQVGIDIADLHRDLAQDAAAAVRHGSVDRA